MKKKTVVERFLDICSPEQEKNWENTSYAWILKVLGSGLGDEQVYGLTQ